MNSFWIDLLKCMVPYCVGLYALWCIAEKLYWAAEYYWRTQQSKEVQAVLELRTARYKSLGVDCHGNCYLFGCKYERITDELNGLGVEQDVLERLVETLNSVPHRQPCDCGKALLPLSSTPHSYAQETEQCNTAEQS